MKTLILSIAILLSLNSTAQTKQDTLNAIKKDSIMNVLVNKTPITEFQGWLYENLLAKQYNETFAQWYNAFLEYKYQQSIKDKPKTTK